MSGFRLKKDSNALKKSLPNTNIFIFKRERSCFDSFLIVNQILVELIDHA